MEKLYAYRACPTKIKLHVPQGQLNTWKSVSEFIFAGRAVFTLKNVKTGVRYTYKVLRPKYKDAKAQAAAPFFVYLLTGPDEYKYLATIFENSRGTLTLTYKSRFKSDSLPYRSLQWILRKLEMYSKGESVIWPAGFQFWHEGKCGRCGRPLTDPASIARGYGPLCATIDNVGG